MKMINQFFGTKGISSNDPLFLTEAERLFKLKQLNPETEISRRHQAKQISKMIATHNETECLLKNMINAATDHQREHENIQNELKKHWEKEKKALHDSWEQYYLNEARVQQKILHDAREAFNQYLKNLLEQLQAKMAKIQFMLQRIQDTLFALQNTRQRLREQLIAETLRTIHHHFARPIIHAGFMFNLHDNIINRLQPIIENFRDNEISQDEFVFSAADMINASLASLANEANGLLEQPEIRERLQNVTDYSRKNAIMEIKENPLIPALADIEKAFDSLTQEQEKLKEEMNKMHEEIRALQRRDQLPGDASNDGHFSGELPEDLLSQMSALLNLPTPDFSCELSPMVNALDDICNEVSEEMERLQTLTSASKEEEKKNHLRKPG